MQITINLGMAVIKTDEQRVGLWKQKPCLLLQAGMRRCSVL